MLQEDIETIEKLAIMIDADGYFYRFLQNQLRTEPHFFEIIQRMGAKGFGFGNFKALF